MYNNLGNGRVNGNTEKSFGTHTGNQQVPSNEVLRFREKPTNKILAALPPADLARLMTFAENINFSGGEIIHQPNETIRFVYFPENAVFSQFQILEDGRMCEISMTGWEGLVGLPAILSCQPERHWTEVSVAGSAVRINARVIEREFDSKCSLQSKIIEFVNLYIGQISQRVICNCHHQISERFCTWLLMLEDRHGSNQFSLTQEQIARFLGVHRPSLSCVAKELQEKNVIAYSRGQLTILNRFNLERSACSCYREN